MSKLFLPAFFFITLFSSSIEIVDFNKDSDLSDWYIVDDGVMGGRSDGNMIIDEDGHAKFYGTVSLENYGGFTSARMQFDTKDISAFAICKIRLKGDGKNYQFRTKSNLYQRHSYIYEFSTSGEWEEIRIPLKELYPSFRGRKLAMENYPKKELAEIVFLIANKRNEEFAILLDRITLEN